ncbi:MAG: hypothetical protein ACK5MT_21785 [Actinomycetales bacterium]
MPRSNRPRRRGRSTVRAGDDAPEMNLGGLVRAESHPDGDWLVRRVAGSSSGRTYVCPGCSQQVSAAIAHVVAWPSYAAPGQGAAVEARRHWHAACWSARDRRGPG